MLNRLNHGYLRYFFYILIFFFLAFNRSKLDFQFPFVSSDSEIKYYQTIAFAEKGLKGINQSSCTYPGFIYDETFRFFPFDYPWAFLKKSGVQRCLFQYPPVFALLNGLTALLLGIKIITFLPLLCLLGCLFIFDRLLTLFIDKGWAILIGTLVTFCLSFPVLSSEEFSEVPLNNLLLLSFGYVLIRSLFSELITIKEENSDSNFKIFAFISGLIAVSAFFLRTESAFPIFLFGFLSFFTKESRGKLVKYLIFSFPGALFAFAAIGTLNHFYSGHLMGIRFLVSSGDTMTQFSIAKQISIFQGYLLGDTTKTGFFKAAPYTILILGIVADLFRKRNLTGESLFGLVGFGTLVSISFLSPYTAGVHHFGLRYLESGFLFLSAGILIFLNQRIVESPTTGRILILVVLFSLYYNYKFTREGFKILFGAIAPYTEIQKEFNSRKIIVHKGQFTNYLIGHSYLTSMHFSANSPKEALELESIFNQNQIKTYSILEYDLEPPRDPNLPEKQFREKIAVRFPDPNRFYKLADQKKILDFTLKTYHQLEKR
ncbi:hypothetical protein AB3N59_08250 [Leptospira sp. WS92.C1]